LKNQVVQLLFNVGKIRVGPGLIVIPELDHLIGLQTIGLFMNIRMDFNAQVTEILLFRFLPDGFRVY